MINKFIEYLKNIDKITYKIMAKGLLSCLFLAIISAFLLLTYNIASTSQDLYYIGLSLFKLSCYFSVEFVICGLVMDSIKKQLI